MTVRGAYSKVEDRLICPNPRCEKQVTQGWELKVVNVCPNCGQEWKLCTLSQGRRVVFALPPFIYEEKEGKS